MPISVINEPALRLPVHAFSVGARRRIKRVSLSPAGRCGRCASCRAYRRHGRFCDGRRSAARADFGQGCDGVDSAGCRRRTWRPQRHGVATVCRATTEPRCSCHVAPRGGAGCRHWVAVTNEFLGKRFGRRLCGGHGHQLDTTPSRARVRSTGWDCPVGLQEAAPECRVRGSR